jgi:hypothetical protein
VLAPVLAQPQGEFSRAPKRRQYLSAFKEIGMALCAGDWVEVRSREEILRTLDKNGRLENMPFMPEMFAYCGKRIRVYKRAHKACDTINPISSRRLPNSVLLGNLRCNGAAHGGCQAQCAIFWKEAWLKPLANDGTSGGMAETATKNEAATNAGCTEADVWKAAKAEGQPSDQARYRCQATDFPLYTTRLRLRHVDQYLEDYRSGNVTLKEMFQTGCYFLFKFIGRPKWEADGGTYAKLYDWFQHLRGGLPYPRRRGKLQAGEEQPLVTLNLQPGEYVRVKSYEEILATINSDNKNRGLYFDAEMVPYCGGVFRVRSRVERFLDEKTGLMLTMKTPAVILEGGWCRSYYSERRAFCPRAIYAWWREAWLERVPGGADGRLTSSYSGVPAGQEVEK